jgi:glucuronoarabinoxylan endo-1,4-beta-xylanase
MLIGILAMAGIAQASSSMVTIHWKEEHQRIAGWGASGGNSSAEGFLKMNVEDQKRLCDLLFDPTVGIGLSMVRNEIYSWELSPSQGVYDWTKDAAQVWLMQQAKQRGVKLFWSAAWSPPAWMKGNGKHVGGAIKPEHYQEYADLLSLYVKEYRKRFGLDMMGISITNEPEVNVDYQSSHWTGDTLRTFIKDHLGPTFAKQHIKAQIIVPETSTSDNFSTFADPILADTDAAKYVGIVATHQYNQSYTGSVPKFPPLEPIKFSEAAVRSAKPRWETEVSFIGGKPDYGIKWGLGLAILADNAVVGADANAWLWWVFLNPWKDNEGLTDIDGKTFKVAKRLWAFGNYSRFVRPGYVRIEATPNPEEDVLVSAFKSPRGNKLVVVAINNSKTERSIDFKIDGNSRIGSLEPWITSADLDLQKQTSVTVSSGRFTGKLVPESITTYVTEDSRS